MPRDFFAPDFEVKVNGSGLEADVSKNITQVSVASEPDAADTLQITLANPFPAMQWTHTDDADLFKEANAIEVRMGYVGALELLFDGEITKISPDFPANGAPTVKVEAQNRLHRLSGGSKTRTFQSVTDTQIAGTIAGDHGLTLDADDTKIVHDYVIQYNQSDMAFLLERARRAHFEMQVDGKKLLFREAREANPKEYTLVWGVPQKSTDPSKNIMPLESFQPTMDTSRQVSAVKVTGYDSKTRAKIEGTAGEGDEETKMGGSQSGSEIVGAVFQRRIEIVDVKTPIASQEEADRLARAIYNDRALELVKGTGSTIGLPKVRAGSVIELQGLGTRFSGEYYVTQCTHTLGGSGYKTTFSVRRNALS